MSIVIIFYAFKTTGKDLFGTCSVKYFFYYLMLI